MNLKEYNQHMKDLGTISNLLKTGKCPMNCNNGKIEEAHEPYAVEELDCEWCCKRMKMRLILFHMYGVPTDFMEEEQDANNESKQI